MVLWKCLFFPVVFHVLSLISRSASGAEVVVAPLPECTTAPGLDRGQMNACRRKPAATAAALRGMAAAAAECRHQFRSQRWNCSALGGGAGVLQTKSNLGGGLPQGGYREVAFARAILTAGIVLEVAKECSIGLLSECTCEPHGWRNNWNTKSSVPGATKVHWKWRGCSQALDFGVDFSKEFMDSSEGAEDAPSRVHQHNSNVGRLAVTSLTKLRCKCHGMSGSCSLRTCWQAPPDLKQVGAALKFRFDTAVMVTSDNIDGDLIIRPVTDDFVYVPPKGDPLRSLKPSRTTGLLRRRRGSSINTISLDEQLLYIERSPSFCERDVTAYVPGTSGRRCRRDGITSPNPSRMNALTIPETDEQDCSIMCCGRGFDLIKAAPSNCRCRFMWCCKVVCDVCKEREDWVAVCK